MAQAVTAPRKRGLWQRMSEFDSRRPLLWNIAPIVMYCIPLGLVIVAGAPAEVDPRHPELQLLLAGYFMVPLIWRRKYPFTVLASQVLILPVVFAYDLTGQGAGISDSAAAIAYFLAMFNLILRRPLNLLWWAAAITLVPTVLDWWVNMPAHSLLNLLGTLVQTGLAFGFIVAIAMLVRTRRDYQSTEREQAAREAVAEERTRIAREMHDIIGHNLAVINALADGGAYAATASPERAKQALEAIGTTSREALGELRRVLSVLKAEDGGEDVELAPQPGLAELGGLIERVREAGLPVTVKTSGDPWELSENQQLAVYRTVQEALTNVLKHAEGTRNAEASLEYRDDGLSVVVANTGIPVLESGTHRGLAGLTERAAAFGGTMEAGPRPAGGWRVALWLPRNGKKKP